MVCALVPNGLLKDHFENYVKTASALILSQKQARISLIYLFMCVCAIDLSLTSPPSPHNQWSLIKYLCKSKCVQTTTEKKNIDKLRESTGDPFSRKGPGKKWINQTKPFFLQQRKWKINQARANIYNVNELVLVAGGSDEVPLPPPGSHSTYQALRERVCCSVHVHKTFWFMAVYSLIWLNVTCVCELCLPPL